METSPTREFLEIVLKELTVSFSQFRENFIQQLAVDVDVPECSCELSISFEVLPFIVSTFGSKPSGGRGFTEKCSNRFEDIPEKASESHLRGLAMLRVRIER